jgi:hypothetical protein
MLLHHFYLSFIFVGRLFSFVGQIDEAGAGLLGVSQIVTLFRLCWRRRRDRLLGSDVNATPAFAFFVCPAF